ncbi:MAG: hypothetical protein EOO01_05850 [Chitinophagaceae bacterium]|nr:MAG: hypothetical protein EOO01_05850 [Chitinophagaceae bacterium]
MKVTERMNGRRTTGFILARGRFGQIKYLKQKSPGKTNGKFVWFDVDPEVVLGVKNNVNYGVINAARMRNDLVALAGPIRSGFR